MLTMYIKEPTYLIRLGELIEQLITNSLGIKDPIVANETAKRLMVTLGFREYIEFCNMSLDVADDHIQTAKRIREFVFNDVIYSIPIMVTDNTVYRLYATFTDVDDHRIKSYIGTLPRAATKLVNRIMQAKPKHILDSDIAIVYNNQDMQRKTIETLLNTYTTESL